MFYLELLGNYTRTDVGYLLYKYLDWNVPRSFMIPKYLKTADTIPKPKFWPTSCRNRSFFSLRYSQLKRCTFFFFVIILINKTIIQSYWLVSFSFTQDYLFLFSFFVCLFFVPDYSQTRTNYLFKSFYPINHASKNPLSDKLSLIICPPDMQKPEDDKKRWKAYSLLIINLGSNRRQKIN